ncbi:MAG: DUF2917 domain-containing protein [Verrucomicrobium sp.]|nr:DUF2917 domain-containing protein [Verrucomicrobium sp.]
MITATPMSFDAASRNQMQRASAPENFPSAKRIRSWVLDSSQSVLLKGYRGQAWVTMEGDPEDHLLRPGMELEFCGPGLLVAEALNDGVIYDWELSQCE